MSVVPVSNDTDDSSGTWPAVRLASNVLFEVIGDQLLITWYDVEEVPGMLCVPMAEVRRYLEEAARGRMTSTGDFRPGYRNNRHHLVVRRKLDGVGTVKCEFPIHDDDVQPLYSMLRTSLNWKPPGQR